MVGWQQDNANTKTSVGEPTEASLCANGFVISHRARKSPLRVSHRQSVELYEALKANGEDVTLKLVPKCKHADDRLFTDEILNEVKSFLLESF